MKLKSDGVRVLTAQRGVDENFEPIVANLADPETPRTLIDELIERTGRLDILVSNAGIMREGSVLETTTAQWLETMQVNLTAPFQLIRYAISNFAVSPNSQC